MDAFLQATIAGVAIASILAVAASGLVLTYTTTGVFNFAHGALGMLGAFAYWQLRWDWGWSAPLSLLVVLVVLAPLVGVLIELVTRGLSDAPEAARVVVTISLLLAALGVGLWMWPGDESYRVERFWGNGASFEPLAGVRVTWHEVTAFVVAVTLAVGLRLFLFNTRSGVAMRAAVDDRPLAMLNGARPNRSAMVAWGIGVACAALSGILMAPITEMSHITLTLLIVNAYAAAILGRLRSLPMTFVGALGLGLADAYLLEYAPSGSELWANVRGALPAIALFAVLMVLRPIPLARSHSANRVRENIPRPRWNGALVSAVAFVGVGIFLANTLEDQVNLLQVSRIAALAIIGLSLVPLAGYGGQLSLCQMSFAGIGAVVMAHHGVGGDPIGLVYAALAAGAVGALVAIPAIRLGGLYFALATAAFATILDQWIFKLSELKIGPWTLRFFPSSTAEVSRVDVPGADRELTLPVIGTVQLPGTTSAHGYLIFLTVVFALCYLGVIAIRRSTFGQRLLAMKGSPAASATIGMNITGVKFIVFTLSAAMAGLGGALYGGAFNGTVSPETFAFVTSLPILLLAVVGGIGAASGAIFAGVMLGGMPMLIDAWPWFENLSEVLPGLMGIALGRNPNGAVPQIKEAFAPLRRSWVALGVTLTLVGAVLTLRLLEVLTGGLYAAALVLAGISGLMLVEAANAVRTRRTAQESGDVPLEWTGIDRPFTPEDAIAMERELGVELGDGSQREILEVAR